MKKLDKPHLHIKGATHPGLTGKVNEDRFQIASYKPGTKRKNFSSLIVVCDGIGGHHAGDVAAEMGVSLITEKIVAGDVRRPLRTLEKAIVESSEAIYQAALADNQQRGMGTTVAIAWVIGERLYTTNLGDTRIYLFRNNYLVQLSTDHTWVQEAIDAGLIREHAGIQHANAHVIRRYLGSKTPPKPDFRLWFFEKERDADAIKNQGLRLKPGDILLLCSDGLTDLVTDEEIQQVLEGMSIEQAPEKLIELANQRAGHDNITVVCAQVPQSGRGVFKRKIKKRFVLGCMGVLVILSLLATGIILGLRWRNQNLQLEETSQPRVTLTTPQETLTLTETRSSTATLSPTFTPEIGTPRPTITPWPTNTP